MTDTKDEQDDNQTKSNKAGIPPVAPHHLLPPKEEENILRRSLKEIGEDMKKMEDLITLTEDILRRERQRDREFYLRERRRKLSENPSIPRHLFQVQKIESKDTQKSQQLQNFDVPTSETKTPSPQKENKSPLTLRKKITKRFKRKSFKSDKRKNSTTVDDETQPQNQPLKSPTLRINTVSGKSVRKLIRFSPRRYRSRLYFRNGKIGCIDPENVAANQTDIEKTHAIVNYITSDLGNYTSPMAAKRSSIKSNISKILSEESSESLDDLPNSNSYFNFEYSATESDDRGIADDDYYVNSLSDIDSFTVQPKSDEELTIFKDQTDDVIEGAIQEQSVDEEMGNNDASVAISTPKKLSTSASDPAMLDFIDETTSNHPNDMDEKPPHSAMSNHSNITLNSDIKNQVRHLVRRFSMRTGKMRKRIEMPPTPSTTSSSQSHLTRNRVHLSHKLASPLRSPSHAKGLFKADEQHPSSQKPFTLKLLFNGVIDPQGSLYISWLCIVSMTFLYNAWVIPLRSTFPFQTDENESYWLAADICADIIYCLDIVFIKHRIMFLHEGFWVHDRNSTRKNYMQKLKFKMDILSLIPLDLLYFKYGMKKMVFVRAPRLLKIQSFWELFRLLDRVIASPYLVRVGRTLTYMLYMIHITACCYYYYSDLQGLASDRWVFSGKGHPYVRCFAFATKTATSIGKNPKPESEGELLFMTVAWLMGVFIFALLIGQIRDIIATATRLQSEYRQLVDETLECMRRLNLPKASIDRVKKWFKFTFEQQRTLDENMILDYLPSNLKTDIAIAVHIQTLSKVQLFANCEEALLRELVLKLRSVTYLPDDYVCRKNEIGKEMYIVKWGQVQVMGGPDNDEVLATLTEGSVFGEISLLAINGVEGKRRTADVKSKGFSNLFVLSKSDLNDALAQYPQAQAILKRRAHSVMRKNAARERNRANVSSSNNSIDVVIKNPTPFGGDQPKLLETVIKALPEESSAVRLLTQGSKRQKPAHKLTITVENHDGKANDANIIDDNIEPIETATEPIASTKSPAEKSDCQIWSVENEKVKAPASPDLLQQIQAALSHRNGFMNLTDSEKAFIANPEIGNDRRSDFLDPLDGRMDNPKNQ
ncbi:cyclic nucleotide-gated cation channel beta-3 [Contarinia nasturtii]|uniref:cyclic nucleotide-gated cation channel beta-3 n=1 Tax=Contarinia nasturtii TaxID=265458 RepID=UPI0012D45EFD|nr:cyclic nucleotide-gated cation channel beta-3 [Contarinia nasturtii]XP_031633674.1 cyclic nucleotide-gated cation channel beta-3 [Contarinia nasturtii]